MRQYQCRHWSNRSLNRVLAPEIQLGNQRPLGTSRLPPKIRDGRGNGPLDVGGLGMPTQCRAHASCFFNRPPAGKDVRRPGITLWCAPFVRQPYCRTASRICRHPPRNDLKRHSVRGPFGWPASWPYNRALRGLLPRRFSSIQPGRTGTIENGVDSLP